MDFAQIFCLHFNEGLVLISGSLVPTSFAIAAIFISAAIVFHNISDKDNASETVINTISDNLDKLTSLKSEAITEILRQANSRIIRDQTKRVKMKSTVVPLAADTDNRQYIWAYVGD